MGQAFTVYIACDNIHADIADILCNEDTEATAERCAYPATYSVEYAQTSTPFCGRYSDDGR
jgi:hypothetical protein